MAFSSYQIERLIERLRRWLGGDYPPRRARPDPVRVTPRGAAMSREPEGDGAPPPRNRAPGLHRVADPVRHPREVEEEIERRAGSFMKPPYPDPPWPRQIPKLRRAEPDDAAPSAGGKAD